MKTTAILLDGGFVTKKLYRMMGNTHATAQDIIAFAKKCLTADEELFRIYFYDCPPFEEVQTHPVTRIVIDYSQTVICTRIKAFQDQLCASDYIAFRRGKLSFKGWVIKKNSLTNISRTGRAIIPADYVPDLEQKRVDIKIGLDVAWLASRKIVQRIILVTADSDFIPAMKFARQEGIQVMLVSLGNLIKKDMREHCDEFRAITYP